jgi:hypothetical protein
MDNNERKRLTMKGFQAINNGHLCVILNAGGLGSNSQYFEESKAWNTQD